LEASKSVPATPVSRRIEPRCDARPPRGGEPRADRGDQRRRDARRANGGDERGLQRVSLQAVRFGRSGRRDSLSTLGSRTSRAGL